MNEETIFAAALEKQPAERAAYLAKACGADAALRKRLEGLLAASDKAGNFMARPAVAAAAASHSATEIVDGESTPNEAAATREWSGNKDEELPEELGFLGPPSRPDSLGRIGHYEVLQILGKGGFGIVFRAFDDVLQRVVAVKVMAPQLAATSPARKRFLREARTSAQVRHENVVQVYEVAEQPLPYLVMEFIPGETLQQRLDRTGPLDVAETLRIGRQIAEGLAAAHATDLIHRDIKPGNVLIESGQQRVKITDFGLARAADDASISQSGIIAGTPMYMAPEQAQGQTLDQRADLFSLGSVLYQMVAGRPPFRANGTLAVLKRVAEDMPRPIREIIPETPQWLCDIIAKLHAKNPDERFQSAREVADVLADCESQLKANSKIKDFSRIPKSKPVPTGRRPRRRVRLAIAVALVLIVTLSGLWVAKKGVGNVYRYVADDSTVEVATLWDSSVEKVIVKKDGENIETITSGTSRVKLAPGRYELQIVPHQGYRPSNVIYDVSAMGPSGTMSIAERDGVYPLILARGDAFRVFITSEKDVGSRPIDAAKTGKPESLSPPFKNSLSMEFVLVPKGKSRLGGGSGVVGEHGVEAVRDVEIAQDFYLGKYEVTQEEWQKVMGKNPSSFVRAGAGKDSVKDVADADLARFPVENVSWDDCQEFIARVNERAKESGWVYRLPTQSEWEYACRGGPLADRRDSAFDYYGEEPTNQLRPDQANIVGKGRTCKVGSFKPNRLGLHDMHGNVWEWCEDVYDAKDASLATLRAIRGGCWVDGPENCRAAVRHGTAKSLRSHFFGLRLARVPTGTPSPEAKTPATAADFREIHGADRLAFDAWLAQIKTDGYVPQTLAVWNSSAGDLQYASVAIRSSDVESWQVVHSSEKADDRGTKIEELSNEGYRPLASAVTVVKQTIGHVQLWIKERGRRRTFYLFSGPGNLLETRLQEFKDKGVTMPISFSTAQLAIGGTMFGQVYGPAAGLGWHVELQLTKKRLLQVLGEQLAKGWQPTCLAVYEVGGQTRYLALCVENRERLAWSVSFDLTAGEYEQELGKQKQQGFRPRHVFARDEMGVARYGVIWQRGAPSPEVKTPPPDKKPPG